GPDRILHILIGTPDEDNCPICKAHAKTGRDPVGGDPAGGILLEELRLHDVLRCPCPMCARARMDSLDV
ncbi:MAG TPA: hypothetical protein VEJ18_06725, partial [Planctomycetota bacterium]|nr:hypothetical protein [Planctomycetota bacterium]